MKMRQNICLCERIGVAMKTYGLRLIETILSMENLPIQVTKHMQWLYAP